MKARINTKGLAGITAELRGLSGGAMREALADALNHTANQARKALRVEMNDVFAQPSPWVLDSIFMQNATAQRLESALWVKENKVGGTGKGFDDWLAPQVFGGARLHKGSEKLLREAGILPAGRFIMPGTAARLDADGNISRGQMVQIVSGLKAFRGKSARMNATSSRRSQQKGNATAFFVMYRGKTPIGVAERRGSQVGIVLAFVSQPRYRQRLRFHEVVEQVANTQLAANVDKAIARVMNR